MTSLPSVVCRTATFGRQELLNEAVESFLRQDYAGPKRMFILDDCPGVEYWCDHPEINIENAPRRFATLGDKFNHLLSSFECDIVVNCPDDDIMLPWAISTIVEKIESRNVFAGRGFWYMQAGQLRKFDHIHCAGVLAFRHHVWKELGGYASMNSGEDQEFFNRMKARFAFEYTELSPSQAYFIYRWNTGFGHLSGYGKHKDGYAAYGADVMNRSRPGVYQIQPAWRHDYLRLVREFLERGQSRG